MIEYKKTLYRGFLFRMYVVNFVLQNNEDYRMELKNSAIKIKWKLEGKVPRFYLNADPNWFCDDNAAETQTGP